MVQPLGEILLQICCKCSNRRSSMQIKVVVVISRSRLKIAREGYEKGS